MAKPHKSRAQQPGQEDPLVTALLVELQAMGIHLRRDTL